MDLKLTFNLVFIVFLLFVNGFFVAAEFALVGVRKTRICQLANEGNFNAKLALDAVKNIDRYIAAIQLGITIASLGIGWVGESTLAKVLLPLFKFLPVNYDTIAAHTVAVAVAFSVITVLHVVIGELMPKSIALQYPENTTLFVAKPMFIVTRLFAPMIVVLNGLGNFLLKLLKIEPASEKSRACSSEELNMLIDASCKGGVIKEQEAEMLQNVFKFSELNVSQIMKPRMEMVCISEDISMQELNEIIIENQFTRYPVYKDDLDHIIGFLHMKDLYLPIINNQEIKISEILRKPLYIPETMSVEKLNMEFQKKHSQMAIVVDEFGGTSGLITHEDVLEEIFGDVQDEFDDENNDLIKKINENEFEILGKTRIDEFEDYFKIELKEDESVNTISGYFVKKFGKMAKINDEITDEYFTYKVIDAESMKILKLKVTKQFFE